jgi:nuclear pore complex protein Nup54
MATFLLIGDPRDDQFLKYAQILRNKGFSIESDEEALRSKLETVQSHLQQSEQFHGKLNQLWAQLQLVREASRIYGGQDDKGWASVSEKDMETISKVRRWCQSREWKKVYARQSS